MIGFLDDKVPTMTSACTKDPLGLLEITLDFHERVSLCR